VGSGFLDVSQRDPGIKCGGDECMPQCVRPNGLADPGPTGDAADDSSGAVPVQAAGFGGHEDRPFCALADGQVPRAVRGASGIVTTLPPLRVITSVRGRTGSSRLTKQP
jgi:hypothetical protein